MEVGDILIDFKGSLATITSMYPLRYDVKYWTGITNISMHSLEILSRFVPLTELTKALV
jgi:hypothetical protein